MFWLVLNEKEKENDYTTLDSPKYHEDSVWFFDLVNINDHHCFQSFFMFKDVLYSVYFSKLLLLKPELNQ